MNADTSMEVEDILRIFKLLYRWQECIDLNGDCVKKTVIYVFYLPCKSFKVIN